jgi:hypothetical protein
MEEGRAQRLERELLVALALPPDVVKSIWAGRPVTGDGLDLLLERLETFAAGESRPPRPRGRASRDAQASTSCFR